MKIGAFIRTLFSRFLLLVLMIIYLIPALFFVFLPEKRRYNSRVLFFLIDLFYRAVIKFSFIPVTIKGRKNIPQESVIFAANHQSSLDVPLLGVLASGKSHIWVAKQELMESPILRWVLPRLAILVDQRSPTKAVRSLNHAIAITKNHDRHLMIFPEGGRYTDGKVHDFYRGFALLARKTGKPVVPVFIKGVNKVYPPDSFIVERHPVTVVVGVPLHIQEEEDDKAFKDRLYAWFVAHEDAS